MSAYVYRCLPNYLLRCDCSLLDQLLGQDCGVEIKSVSGGSDAQGQPLTACPALVAPLPGDAAGRGAENTETPQGCNPQGA